MEKIDKEIVSSAKELGKWLNYVAYRSTQKKVGTSVQKEEDVSANGGNLKKKIAEAATEGFTPEGGMIYERNLTNGHVDADRHWWVQAETVVGYINLYQHFGDEASLDKALACWEFTKSHLIDRVNGEWFWSLRADGTINHTDDKAGFWKCPYHNGRMCMEIMERF
jgi:mannobiose 2-epimerase